MWFDSKHKKLIKGSTQTTICPLAITLRTGVSHYSYTKKEKVPPPPPDEGVRARSPLVGRC